MSLQIDRWLSLISAHRVSPLSLRPTSFGFLSRELDIFLLSRPLLLSPLHHTELPRHSIIWQLFSLLSMIDRSNLLSSISWRVRILKCHSIIIIIIIFFSFLAVLTAKCSEKQPVSLGVAAPTRLIFWSSSILMFPEIFFTYFPRPYFTRLSAPIIKRTVSAFYEIKRVWFDSPLTS